jgi:hypothetical protein
LNLTKAEEQLLESSFELLIREAMAQPQVFVHRDYHSRNLMVVEARNPGILDFQDALRGPVGYDLVSLLKDCYIAWPRERVERWLQGYRAMLGRRGFDVGSDEKQFLRWFDLIGVQRHIKVLGIFARLWYRDGKPAYLQDLPLTLEYVRDACKRYEELSELSRFFELRVVPELPQANRRVMAGQSSPEAGPVVAGLAVSTVDVHDVIDRQSRDVSPAASTLSTHAAVTTHPTAPARTAQSVRTSNAASLVKSGGPARSTRS